MDFDKILFKYRYMIHVVTNTHYFLELFNRVMTLDSFLIIGGFDQIW